MINELRPIRFDLSEGKSNEPIWSTGWFHAWIQKDGKMLALVETKSGKTLIIKALYTEFIDRDIQSTLPPKT